MKEAGKSRILLLRSTPYFKSKAASLLSLPIITGLLFWGACPPTKQL